MNKTNIIKYALSWIFFFGFIITGCSQAEEKEDDKVEGILELIPQFYRIENNKSIPTWGEGLRKKVWYKNTATITEIKAFFSTTNNGIKATVYPTQCYLFKYLSTGMIYEYRNFSDTAQPLQSFKKTDYVNLVASNIDYQDEQQPYLKLISAKHLPDTLVDQVSFKSAIIHRQDSTGNHFYFLMHFRCDINNKFLKFFDSTRRLNSIPFDCPMIKFHAVLSAENRLPLFTEEITFFADSLTSEEKKVFEAWEKRAKEDALHK